MSRPFLTPAGAEALLLLTGTGRPVQEIFSLLRYESADIHACITDLSRRWLVEPRQETITLTLLGRLLTGKILAMGPFWPRDDLGLAPKRTSGDSADWIDDPDLREAMIRDLFHSYPWLEMLPDLPQGTGGGTVPENPADSREPGSGETPADDLFRTSMLIQQFGYFFMMHAIETLPAELNARLGDLYRSRIFTDIPVDFKQDLDFYIEIIRQAGKIRGVSTFTNPRIAFEMAKRILHGTDIELIVSPELAGTLLAPPYRDIALRVAGLGNIRFRISRIPIEVGLTVTERHLSLGFFTRKEHHYDRFYDLVSTTPRACRWGEDLYRYYWENSLPADDFFPQIHNS